MSLERWSKAIDGKQFEYKGEKFQFSVEGAYAEGKRPKIGLIIIDDFPEPYATLTHNDTDVKLAEDEILVRSDGHHVMGANAAFGSGLFEKVNDKRQPEFGKIWRLKGGLP